MNNMNFGSSPKSPFSQLSGSQKTSELIQKHYALAMQEIEDYKMKAYLGLFIFAIVVFSVVGLGIGGYWKLQEGRESRKIKKDGEGKAE